MKSLVIKDLFNIGHNAKTMLILYVFLSFILIPQAGLISYIITSGILSSMMIITTFSLDDNSKWLKHAMVTPITRKEIVSSKFIVLLIFTLLGIVISTATGVVSNFLLNSLSFSHLISFDDLLLVFISSITISSFFGSIVIPLLFKFGVEQARILSIIAFSLTLLVCFLLYKLLSLVGVIFTDDFVKTIMYLSPLFILIWLSIMYELSYYCFKNKEIA